jgi:hypothetical protein
VILGDFPEAVAVRPGMAANITLLLAARQVVIARSSTTKAIVWLDPHKTIYAFNSAGTTEWRWYHSAFGALREHVEARATERCRNLCARLNWVSSRARREEVLVGRVG